MTVVVVSVFIIILRLIISGPQYCHGATEWELMVTVDGVNGINDTSCVINGGQPCATLNIALKGISLRARRTVPHSSVRIDVRPGNYTLEYKTSCDLSNITINILSIIGSGMNETAINCEPSAGLFIRQTIHTTIDSISFHNCGYRHNAKIHFIYPDDLDIFKTGALIVVGAGHYERVKSQMTPFSAVITNVGIYNSIRAGILIYPSVNVIITNSLFTGANTHVSYEELQIQMPGVHVSAPFTEWPLYIPDNITWYLNITISHSTFIMHLPSRYPDGSRWLYSFFDLSGVSAVAIESSCHDIYNQEIHVTIDSCYMRGNDQGIHLYSEYLCYTDLIAKNYKFVATIKIVNTELSSVNKTNLIVMQNNNIIHFDFIDVNITDVIIVYKSLLYSDDSCHGSVITIAKSCSKHETCQFPEFQFEFYELHYFDANIFGPGICSNNCILDYYTKDSHCPIPYSVEYQNGILSCWGNHQGELCGQCIEGHSVAINSPFMPCVPCNDTMTVLKGWGLSIALEFIPVTVMVAVIAVLNVNLNQGSLKAYIFFCQILTIPFPSVSYPSWFVIAYRNTFHYKNIPLVPFAIWNLGFISYPSCTASFLEKNKTICDSDSSICISHNTTALGAISFWYLIAFYPFILLFLLYLCVLAYDRGFYCIFHAIKVLHHRILVHFQRKFNIQPSLPHTIASVYTLCFTQLAATSLKLLHFTTYDNELRFFYDGSQRYFSGWHGAAGTLALIVLIVFIIVPVVYLSVYPFMWFQKCLNKVKTRKDLLISVTDVFTAPYSDGTQDTWDYRYYASSHFILQLLVMVLYYIPSPDYSIMIIVLQICLCSLFLMSLVVFRPYKRKVHVFTEAILLLVLIASSLTMLYIRSTESFVTNMAAFSIYGFFFLFSVCFCCMWCSRKCYKSHRVNRSQETIDEDEELELPERRLVNPSLSDDTIL